MEEKGGRKGGMEVRRRREWKRNRKEIDGEIKKTSIPAKAGISAAKPHSPTGDYCNVPLSRNFPLTRE